MKHIKYITLIVALFATMACTISDIDDVNVQTDDKRGAKISVYGQITRFDDCDVNTRANKTPEEAYVSKMALAVFPIVDGEIQDCISYGLKDGSNLLFTLDRSKMDKEEYANQPFALYIFTNMPNLPESGFTGRLDELLNLALANPGLTRPENGFPMVGSLGDPNRDGKEFILMPMSGNRMELPTVDGTPTDYLNIPMDAIFAKVSFSINVAADQDIASSAPSMFEMTGYKINNLPTAVCFNKDLNEEGKQSVKDSAVEVALSGIAKGSAESGGSIIEFDFYLPERYLTPQKAINDVLPDELKKGIYDEVVDKDQNGYRDEDEKYHQRFKPLLVEGQKPTYITIMGRFRDHQEETYTVEYDIYLGADNYSDFNLERNNQYINSMTIRGISSSNDQSLNGSAVAIDHRVNVTRSMPLIISFRRETLLDAHFEVRPLRLRLVGENIPTGTATVQVLNQDGTIPNWIRLENSRNTADHITEGVSKGKRKYFTTDLVTNTLAEKGKIITVNNLTGTNQAVWVYVDENTTTQSRAAIVRVSYDGVDKDYKIVQQGLYKVVGADSGKDYYIEQYEEYLYNYDAEDSYGQTKQEGMPWGLNGVQLSKEHYSFNVSLTPNVDWAKYETKGARPYYDFYTWRQDSLVLKNANIAKTDDRSHDINSVGQHFTSKIYQNSNGEVAVLTMAEQADGAVEYCYNRNKRNSDGSIAEVVWYLPSADELEDFIVPAYASFKEFQDNYYWTSQPAYIRNVFYYEYQARRGGSKTISAPIVYDDNTSYARATKIVRKDGAFIPAKSGLNFSPTPDVNRTPSGYTNVGYFDKMHYYKHYYKSIISSLTEVYGPDKLKDENRTGDEQYSHNGDYFFHLQIPVESLIEKTNDGEHGYHLRTKHNRVRCVRKK